MMKKIYCMLLAAGVLTSCSSGNNPDPVDSTDRVAMLTNEGNNVIIPSFEKFVTSTAALTAAAQNFTPDPADAQKLDALQAAWLDAAVSWKKASLFTQGPIENDFLSSGIYFNATNFSTIEKSIAQTTTPIDNAYIESLGATAKGIPAIEYLIYHAGGDAAVAAAFAGAAGKSRAAYLNALCENLGKQAELVLKKWKAGDGDYVTTFIKADGRDINSSLGILSNKMIDLVYTIKDERLGAPLGKRNSGTPQPDLVDARISNESLTLLKAELAALENAFSGKNPAGADGAGFDALLDQVDARSDGALLSAKIRNQFAAVNAKLALVTVPLRTAVQTETAQVSAVYDEVKKLQVMMEVDMINNLGVLLTFSDNDGD